MERPTHLSPEPPRGGLSSQVLEKVRVPKGSKWSGVKLGKEVTLEKGVVIEDN